MPEYRVATIDAEDIAQLEWRARDAGVPADAIAWQTLDDGSIIVRSDTLTEAELAALSVVEANWQEPLPAAVLAAGRIVKQAAYLTDAELSALTVAELRTLLRATCRALLYVHARFESIE
jgi:hypothetical protein